MPQTIYYVEDCIIVDRDQEGDRDRTKEQKGEGAPTPFARESIITAP